MKKFLAILLSVTLIMMLTVSTAATEQSYLKAEELSDEVLLQLAMQGTDQRSVKAREATNVGYEVKIQDLPRTRGVEPTEESEYEVYTVTLLEGRYMDEAGELVEEYSSTVIVPYSSVSTNKTESKSSQNGVVYARVNYTTITTDFEVRIKMTSTSHKVVNSASTATALKMRNTVYRNHEMLTGQNSSTKNSPSSNTWYSLASRDTNDYSLSATVFGAESTAYFGASSPLIVECMVEGG